jgi:hypothetical protein
MPEMKVFYTFPLVIFLLGLGACKKPVTEITDNYIPPLVLSTSIHDTLPSKAVKTLKLENLTGVKFQYYTGLYSSYFEYYADKNLVLGTLSELPFSMHADAADTRCREISFQELREIRERISPTELENSFWNLDETNVETYECVKPPFRHILHIPKNTSQVFHLIEFFGYS